jgi:hypothetical protein
MYYGKSETPSIVWETGAMPENEVSTHLADASQVETPQGSAPEKTPRKRRWLIIATVLTLAVVVLIWSLNEFAVNRPLQRVLSEDRRNHTIRASAHWRGWINPDELVFDITGLSGDASRADVLRVFLQYADAMKNQKFSRIYLAARGRLKFTIDGPYFQELGAEYNSQNPMYTIRTFPTRVTTIDGIHPFSEYEGGLLGVLDAEMQQFTRFSDEWYLNDFQSSLKASSSDASTSNFDPCEGLREKDPHCGWKAHWDDSGVSVNPMDGTKSEFLAMESLDATDAQYGSLRYAELRLCFENGKLCGGKDVGVAIEVHGMLQSVDYDSEYSTLVRVRFGEGNPVRQTWGISDDHEALFPHGHEKQFASQLLQHNKLYIEFSYFEKAPRTISFDLAGLDDSMKSKGLAF